MELEGWSDFFLGAAGAAAALAGLVVVAISVNIERILAYVQLPARAAATVGAFVVALVVSLVCLAPQSRVPLGIEIAVFGAAGWVLQTYAGRATIRSGQARDRPAFEAAFAAARGQLQALPFVVGGVFVAIGLAAGPNVLLVAITLTLILAMGEAWILLVEILR